MLSSLTIINIKQSSKLIFKKYFRLTISTFINNINTFITIISKIFIYIYTKRILVILTF